jgi:hypothetical protein
MLDAMKGRNVQHPLHVRHIQRNYRSGTTRLLLNTVALRTR